MKVLIFLVALTAVAANALDLNKIIKAQFASSDIISGVEAERSEAPYIVSLKTTSHFCGGSVFAANWVITAGHCIIYDNFEVVAGLHQRNDESQVQKRSVNRKLHTIVHSLYSGSVGPNDIGLIYIEKAFDFSEISRATGQPLVSAVQLPSRQFSLFGDGVLFGWGRDLSNNLPNNLQKLDTQIIGYEECKRNLPSNAPIDPVNVCSYNKDTVASACNGDSGGPLVKTTGQYTELIGIVSWGYTPCQTTKYPSVYTGVDSFLDWIAEQQKNYVPA